MREQVVFFNETSEKWWEGSQHLIPANDERYFDVQKMFAKTEFIFCMHSHPIGSCRMSQIDIDSMKALCFTTGKTVVMILISGIEWCANIFRIESGKIVVYENAKWMWSRRHNLIALEMIRRSEYEES